jgi:hypothetical protein
MDYSAYVTVLMCPTAYAREHPVEAAQFDAVIPVEDICEFLPQ